MNSNLQNNYQRPRAYLRGMRRFYQRKQTQAYTGIIFSILTLAFFLFFAIKPTVVTIASLIKEINDQKLVAQKLDKKIADLTQAQKNYQLVAHELYLVEEALPTDPQLSIFIKELETLSRQSNLLMEGMQFEEVELKGDTKLEEKAKEINFNLSLSSSFQNLKAFLQRLNLLRRKAMVDGFAFKIKKEGEPLILDVDAKVYYLNFAKKNE